MAIDEYDCLPNHLYRQAEVEAARNLRGHALECTVCDWSGSVVDLVDDDNCPDCGAGTEHIVLSEPDRSEEAL